MRMYVVGMYQKNDIDIMLSYLSRVASDCANMTGGESVRVRIYFAN